MQVLPAGLDQRDRMVAPVDVQEISPEPPGAETGSRAPGPERFVGDRGAPACLEVIATWVEPLSCRLGRDCP
jgi:hypothetical protein